MKTKAERIEALITDTKSPFTKDDKATLEALSEAELTILEGQDRSARIKALVAGSKPEPAKPAEPVTPAATPTVAATTPKTEAEFLATIPAGMLRDNLEQGLRVGKEKHAVTIKTLKDTGRCPYSDEQLSKMSQGELDNLVALAGAPKVDFGGLGAPKVMTDKDAVPAPPDQAAAIRAAQEARRKK